MKVPRWLAFIHCAVFEESQIIKIKQAPLVLLHAPEAISRT